MFRIRSFVRLSLAVCLAVFFAANVLGQTSASHPVVDPHYVDGTAVGGPIDLTSMWLMVQGDDLRYADPSFDDGKWIVVQAGKKADSYGFKHVDRVWYRTHVHVAPGQRDLSLLVRSFGGVYQIYVNGVEVGASRRRGGGAGGPGGSDEHFIIPENLLGSGDLTIAVRAGIGPRSEGGTRQGGFTSSTKFLLGPTSLLSDNTLLYFFRSYAAITMSTGMEVLVALIALALALTLTREKEYIALFISSGAAACIDGYGMWRTVTNGTPPGFVFLLLGLLQGVQLFALLEFVRLALGLRRSKVWAAYEWMIAFLLPFAVREGGHVITAIATNTSSSDIVIAVLVAQIFMLPVTWGLPLLALWVWRRSRNPDALLLFIPLFLQAAVRYAEFAIFVLSRMHLTELTTLPDVPTETFFVRWSEVATLLFNVFLLMFLVLRTVRIARSRAAMASDLNAVQGVQEILLARATKTTPGFRVEHVYYPASEVGGDFFLVSPGADGSLTAIVGDVSGKGLVAAMRVSMILGVLRREENRDPTTILQNLNEALLMQNDLGFTTACCVRLQRDGRYVVANAGHIPPYVGGVEIETPSALPLGLQPHQTYEHVAGILPVGKTMVLMSDGVVEARSKKGELYGFDRLGKLTLMTANDIADVARRFGQEDDITVLTLACA